VSSITFTIQFKFSGLDKILEFFLASRAMANPPKGPMPVLVARNAPPIPEKPARAARRATKEDVSANLVAKPTSAILSKSFKF